MKKLSKMKTLCAALVFATIFCAPLSAQEKVATPEQKFIKDNAPESLTPPPESFKLGITEMNNLSAPDQTRINRLNLESNEVIQSEAARAFKDGNFNVADKLYAILCQRDSR